MLVRRGRDVAFSYSRATRISLSVLCMRRDNDRFQLARGCKSVSSAVEDGKLNFGCLNVEHRSHCSKIKLLHKRRQR